MIISYSPQTYDKAILLQKNTYKTQWTRRSWADAFLETYPYGIMFLVPEGTLYASEREW